MKSQTLRIVSLCVGILLVLIVFTFVHQWNYLTSDTRKNYQERLFSIQNYRLSTTSDKYSHTDEYFPIREAIANTQSMDLTRPLSESSKDFTTSESNSSYQTTGTHCGRIAFLKVHKAGSSTAQNIFLRYGETRNLTFLISRVRKRQWDNVISVDSTLNSDNTMPPPKNKTFDIMCCHVLYDNEAWTKYMPADTAFIGIIREPFEQFLSTMNYFNPLRRIKSQNKVFEYLQKPQAYEKGLSPRKSLTNNRMAAEFGFPLELFTNYSKAESNAYLKKLDKEFKFVIIMDYFMESIVMMRRILRWTIKDILYLKKNAARKAYYFVDYTHRYLYADFAKLDYDLYDHFFTRLWDLIRNEGPDFHAELLYFSRLRKEVEDFCLMQVRRKKIYHVAQSKWNDAFNVTVVDCNYLKMQEMTFIGNIRERQYGKARI